MGAANNSSQKTKQRLWISRQFLSDMSLILSAFPCLFASESVRPSVRLSWDNYCYVIMNRYDTIWSRAARPSTERPITTTLESFKKWRQMKIRYTYRARSSGSLFRLTALDIFLRLLLLFPTFCCFRRCPWLPSRSSWGHKMEWTQTHKQRSQKHANWKTNSFFSILGNSFSF